MIPSFDLEKTVSFFTDLLEFRIDVNHGTYFVLSKDNLTLHIQRRLHRLHRRTAIF